MAQPFNMLPTFDTAETRAIEFTCDDALTIQAQRRRAFEWLHRHAERLRV